MVRKVRIHHSDPRYVVYGLCQYCRIIFSLGGFREKLKNGKLVYLDPKTSRVPTISSDIFEGGFLLDRNCYNFVPLIKDVLKQCKE